jgi:selT/selW/selH-like putative selenoprotein
LAEHLFNAFRGPIGQAPLIEEVQLVPSEGGVFEVEADGETVFSKKAAGRHCEPEEIEEALRRRR